MRKLLFGLGLLIALGAGEIAGRDARAQEAAPEETDSALAEVYACAEITDDAARLACFDAAVAQVRGAELRGDIVTVERIEADRIEREAFGFTLPSLPRLFARGNDEDGAAAEELSEVPLEVASLSTRGGKPAFVMTNGQVWVQVDTANVRRVRAGGTVRIRRAAMGSFLMLVDAGGPSIRVRRHE